VRDGAGVAGAKVVAGSTLLGDGTRIIAPIDSMRTTITANDGSFAIHGLSPEAAFVVAEHPTLGRSHVAPADGADLILTLVPTGGLRGRITRNGHTIAASVTAKPDGESVAFDVGANPGEYRFDGLVPGAYQVTAEHGGAHTSGRAVVTAGAMVDLDLDFGTGSTLTVRVAQHALIMRLVLVPGEHRLATTAELPALDGDDTRVKFLLDLPGRMTSDDTASFEDLPAGTYTACSHAFGPEPAADAAIRCVVVRVDGARPNEIAID
jgi:hypothetical protein